MKKLLLLLWFFAPLFSMAQTDDIYYVPKKKVLVINNSGETYFADVDNHRNNVEELSDETEVYYTDDLSDIDDYRYSRRIIRFKGIRCNLSSSLYFDLKYGGGYRDWRVVDNGYNIDIYPTANNPLFYWGRYGFSINIWNWDTWQYPSWSYYRGWDWWMPNHNWSYYHMPHWHNPFRPGGGYMANNVWKPSRNVYTSLPTNGRSINRRGSNNLSVVAGRVVNAGKMDAGGRNGKREEKRELALERQKRRKDNAESMRKLQQRMQTETRIVNNTDRMQRRNYVSTDDYDYTRDRERYSDRRSSTGGSVSSKIHNMQTPIVVPLTGNTDNGQMRNAVYFGNAGNNNGRIRNNAVSESETESRRMERNGSVEINRERENKRTSSGQDYFLTGYERRGSTSVTRSEGKQEHGRDDKPQNNKGQVTDVKPYRFPYEPDNKASIGESERKRENVRNVPQNNEPKSYPYQLYENINKTNTKTNVVNMTNQEGVKGFEFDYDKPAPWQKHHSNTSDGQSSRSNSTNSSVNGQRNSGPTSILTAPKKKSVFGNQSRGKSKSNSTSRSGSSRSSSSYSRSNSSYGSSTSQGGYSRSSSSGSKSRNDSRSNSGSRGGRGR